MRVFQLLAHTTGANFLVFSWSKRRDTVRLRLILDIVAPVGGFHFVDAASVPGRQWLRYVGDTSWFPSPLNSRRRSCRVGGARCCGAAVSKTEVYADTIKGKNTFYVRVGHTSHIFEGPELVAYVAERFGT